MLEHLGVQSVRLDLPFRLNHVNCFLAEGENGWTVIDTGLHNEQTASRWEKELAGKDVTNILLTHYHPDHFGYAGQLQQKTGAKLAMTQIDEQAAQMAWDMDFLNTLAENYKVAAIPEDIAGQMIENTKAFVPRVTPYPAVHHHFEEGEKVVIGRYVYEVIFTPGHSDGLITFYNKEQRVLFSTDHILPKITPNISYWFHGDPNPLATYLASLEKMKKLDAELVIPSHGRPFYGANDRIDEIMAHHEQRLDQTLTAVGKSSRVYDVCQKLFPKELTIHETRFAIGETLSHLEYLRAKGELGRHTQDGQWVYLK
ncbi:Hydroxyacylglutathione hydrolase [Lentibacillus sp. JNUCC-1]|uniref:MBL fold metallo-hydrolase n=1 Tax=Lentibacillus sp. JNUCC-1 TaxID=2654513 RepID=UPI0012E729C5|nr:MBL fold metallo-hydrolase [Lentibacillus sp. JNUCC-1]MUV37779.1 Hydroxyacylglutathione hydrolase [Lentibacillus sp. JNUCC-1]